MWKKKALLILIKVITHFIYIWTKRTFSKNIFADILYNRGFNINKFDVKCENKREKIGNFNASSTLISKTVYCDVLWYRMVICINQDGELTKHTLF